MEQSSLLIMRSKVISEPQATGGALTESGYHGHCLSIPGIELLDVPTLGTPPPPPLSGSPWQ